MPGKKKIAGLISFLSGLLLLAVILLSVVEYKIFDLDFYKAEFVKLDTARTIGISDEDLLDTTVQLLAYIKGERKDLEIEAEINQEKKQVFNTKEIAHMADVRQLYQDAHWFKMQGIVFLVFLLSLLIALTGSRFLKTWAAGYLAGTGVFFLLTGFIVWTIQKDFLMFWNNLHYLLFTNDLWMLNPQEDILIQIVPEQFFFDLVEKILLIDSMIVVVLAIIAAGIFLRERKKKYDKI